MHKIPIYQPSLSGNEKKYVSECLDTNWISSKGRFVKAFEESFSNYIKVKHSTAVSNGTVALHLALLALGIGPGDEVIVPTLTYIASVNAVCYTGATPVFVDSLETTWQIDPDDIKKKISSKTKAVMVVHLYGHPCDMGDIMNIAKSNDLFVIEDCAEAIGSFYKDRHVGGFGNVSTFSFYGNKTITTGEGGMVVTNDDTLYERVVHFKGQGLAKYREYWHDVVGYNYRMTNICAAIGLAQLENVEDVLKRKRMIAYWYKTKTTGLPVTFHDETGDVIHSYWMCSILVNNPDDRDSLRVYLGNAGIETRPLFYPIHTMPMFSARYQQHSVAENLGRRGINLPSWADLEEKDVDYIINEIKSFYNNCKL
jgi:perosamine synthetase